MHETLKEDTMIAAHKGERVNIGPDTGHTAVMSNERAHSARVGGDKSGNSGRPLVIDNKLTIDGRYLQG
jgi:hypothetical protein